MDLAYLRASLKHRPLHASIVVYLHKMVSSFAAAVTQTSDTMFHTLNPSTTVYKYTVHNKNQTCSLHEEWNQLQ